MGEEKLLNRYIQATALGEISRDIEQARGGRRISAAHMETQIYIINRSRLGNGYLVLSGKKSIHIC